MATRPVLVGVDGSEESLRAVEWAAMQAKRHGSPLRIVSAPAMPPRMRAEVDPVTVANALRGMSAQALAAALTRSDEVAPGLPVDTGLVSGPPAVALAAAARDASMLVVGARGIGGFTAMILGSVSRYVAVHAACPVIVVRQETSAVHREIAVGIRETEYGTAALAFAFEEAALRDAELVAVHALPVFPSALHVPGAGRATLQAPSHEDALAEAASQLARQGGAARAHPPSPPLAVVELPTSPRGPPPRLRLPRPRRSRERLDHRPRPPGLAGAGAVAHPLRSRRRSRTICAPPAPGAVAARAPACASRAHGWHVS